MKFRILYIVFFVAITGYAQLPAFTLQIATTNETCSNNGTITLTPDELTPLATLTYTLYKMPAMTELAQFTNNFYGGLDSGDYQVRADQVLGADASPPVILQFTITDQYEENLSFDLEEIPASPCGSGGIEVINVVGNSPYFYQIKLGSGPYSAPQLSNQFIDLDGGQYRVLVIDACGNSLSQTHTLAPTSNDLQISATANPPIAISCTEVQVNNDVTPSNGTIFYPLTAKYTVYFPLPVGTQEIIQEHPTGPPDLLPLTLTLPVENTLYNYDLLITDSCDHAVSLTNNIVDPNPSVSITDHPNECGDKYIIVGVTNVMPPYTMTFIEYPTGFDPAAGVPSPIGQLTDTAFQFGSDTDPVPYGTYEVSILDSCGRTEGVSYEVELKEIEAIVTGVDPNCTTGGQIRVQIEESRKVVSVTITVAPPEYAATHPLPSNVSPSEPILTHFIQNLPVGHYEMIIVDSCNQEHPGIADIEPFDAGDFIQSTPKASCPAGLGSLRLRSPNGGGLVTLTMTGAPPEFQGTLPLDLTASLTAGNYFNGSLPEGDYNFTGTDACGATLTIDGGVVTVPGYQSGSNNFVVHRNCGTFDLELHDSSNVIGTYWLQEKNPDTGLYEHPDTGVVYTENTPPDETNSIQLSNNSTRYNITNTGIFRIAKVYQSYDNNGPSVCYDYYNDFTFSGHLDILGVYSLNCIDGSGPGSVFIDVLGVPPYIYRITEKDGQPFIVESNNIDVFQGLEPALYKFEVKDVCDGTVTITINVATLQPLVVATDPGTDGGPGELLYCSNSGETTAPFDLTAFNTEILGNQPADLYTISYHLSEADANSGDNPITTDPTQYVNTTNPQTIWARVIHNTLARCHDIISFRLFVGTQPTLTILPDIYLCEGEEQRVFADNGFDAYEWSTGATTRYIDIDTPGTYSVTVMNNYGSSVCSATQTITVTNTESAHVDSVDIQDWSDFDNSFTMHVSGDGDYVFSIDGLNYQADPTFTGLEPGVYTVDIKDLHGCPSVTKDILILNYPKFFTPNGDGYNETWKIKNSVFEPGMLTYIFDRFGKLITAFDHDSQGWDGTYNGQPLPSTDYWFMVERIDGKVHRGHFAMKR